MPSTLYVSDLDGTLLDGEARLSDRSRALLTEMLGNGLHFTVASARSVFSIKAILDPLPLKLPVIEFNGAYISDYDSGRHLIINSLDRPLCRDIYALIRNADLHPWISCFDGSADRLVYSRVEGPAMEWYMEDRIRMKDHRLCRMPDLEPAFDSQVVCITIMGDRDRLTPVYRQLVDTYGDLLQM